MQLQTLIPVDVRGHVGIDAAELDLDLRAGRDQRHQPFTPRTRPPVPRYCSRCLPISRPISRDGADGPTACTSTVRCTIVGAAAPPDDDMRLTGVIRLPRGRSTTSGSRSLMCV